MATYNYYIGKGMKEPCSPNREDYCFGADLNDFSADGWNCLPNIWDGTSAFNVSALTPDCEVPVALCNVDVTAAGTYRITFKWYRDDRPGEILYESYYEGAVGAGQWIYGYSFIGWASAEIVVNGNYHVDIDVKLNGSPVDSDTINFSISGISAVGEAGHFWTYNTGIYFLDDGGIRRAAAFIDTTENGTAGYLWVEGTYLHYIDGNGDERRWEGTDMGLASGSVSGHIWIDFGSIFYIDNASHKRRILCSAF